MTRSDTHLTGTIRPEEQNLLTTANASQSTAKYIVFDLLVIRDTGGDHGCLAQKAQHDSCNVSLYAAAK